MRGHYNVYLAVDFFNSDILFVANSSGELSQKIITAIANHELESDGAVRLYRTSTESFNAIKQLMSRYRLPFHEAAKPKGAIMTITQLTLLDDQSFREIRRSKYVVILVQELRNNIVQRKKKKAVVCLNAYDMKIKNELFDDCLGNRYVGCTLLKGSHYSSTDAQIPVFKIKLNIQDYLAKKLVPIIDDLDQKRRNYYAN